MINNSWRCIIVGNQVKEKTTKNVDNSFEHVQFSSNHLEKAFKNSDETTQGIPLVPNVCTILLLIEPLL